MLEKIIVCEQQVITHDITTIDLGGGQVVAGLAPVNGR